MSSTRHDRHSDHGPAIKTAIAAWRETEEALTPVIGRLGYDALLERTLRAIGGRYHWLKPVAAASAPARLRALEQALAARDPAQAAAAQSLLQSTFAQLLEHLIGRALARRLLREHVKTFPLSDAEGDTER